MQIDNNRKANCEGNYYSIIICTLFRTKVKLQLFQSLRLRKLWRNPLCNFFNVCLIEEHNTLEIIKILKEQGWEPLHQETKKGTRMRKLKNKFSTAFPLQLQIECAVEKTLTLLPRFLTKIYAPQCWISRNDVRITSVAKIPDVAVFETNIICQDIRVVLEVD